MASALTDEQIKFLRTAVVNTLRENLVARTIFPTSPIGKGKRKFDYDEESEMGAAGIVHPGNPFPEDKTELTRRSVRVSKIGKAFSITFEDQDASETEGMPLSTRLARQAARRVAELEEQILLLGNTTYTIDGIENVAGSNTTAAAATWSNAAAKPYQDVNDAITKLEEDNVDTSRMVLIVPRATYGHLRRLSAQDNVILDQVLSIVPRVVPSATITATQALLVAPSPENFEIAMSEDAMTKGPVMDEKQEKHFFKVRERFGFAIYHPTAICKITGVA